MIEKSIEFPHKIVRVLNERYDIDDEKMCQKCCQEILNISDECGIDRKIENILQGIIERDRIQTAKYQFKELVVKMGYISSGQSYWAYMRRILQQIICHNILKANLIQKGAYHGEYQNNKEQLKKCFERLDLIEILKTQNTSSRDSQNGFIWVLNTCVFFVAEYNFSLIFEQQGSLFSA